MKRAIRSFLRRPFHEKAISSPIMISHKKNVLYYTSIPHSLLQKLIFRRVKSQKKIRKLLFSCSKLFFCSATEDHLVFQERTTWILYEKIILFCLRRSIQRSFKNSIKKKTFQNLWENIQNSMEDLFFLPHKTTSSTINICFWFSIRRHFGIP